MAYISDQDSQNQDTTQAAASQRLAMSDPLTQNQQALPSTTPGAGAAPGANGSTGSSPDSGSASSASAPSDTPSTGGGGGGLFGNVAVGGSATAGTNPAPQSNSSNTGFVNLSNYLDANQSQGTQMGQNIAGAVNTQAQGAQSDESNLNSNWNNEVSADTVNSNPNAVNTAITDATTGNPTSNANWNTDANAFEEQAGANYTGPTDFTTQSGYGAASTAANNAMDSVNELGSEAGRDVLLQNQYNNTSANGYNQGENTLDQALVENNSGAQKAISNTAQQWDNSNLVNSLSGSVTSGDAAAQQAAATDQATAAAAAAALGNYGSSSGSSAGTSGTTTAATYTAGTGALGQFANSIEAQTTAAQNAYAAANQGITGDVNAGNLSATDLTALGLTGSEQTYGLTPAQLAGYIQSGAAPTMANSATSNQYAEESALNQLAGYLPSGAGNAGTAPLSAADAAQASTAGPAFSLNSAGLQNQIAQNKATYNNLAGSDYNKIMSVLAPGQVTVGDNMVEGNQNSSFPTEAQALVNPSSLDAYSQAVLAAEGNPNNANYNNLISNFNQLGQTYNPNSTFSNLSGNNVSPSRAVTGVPSNPTPALAFGGAVPHAPTVSSIASPAKELRAPKLPKPDVHLPTMPHFASGGDVQETLGKRINFPDADPTPSPTGKSDDAASGGLWSSIKAAIGVGQDDAAKNFKAGGKVGGRAHTPLGTNSYANDTVKADLSPQEVVVPRSITQGPNPGPDAAAFVENAIDKDKAE